MLPFREAQWFLGYSNLAMIMEQDRRHWLLRTDKMKQTQDARTGNMYLGQIDNQGSYINISTERLGTVHPVIIDAIVGEGMNRIFQLEAAALPFTYELNGLSCARIISTQYPYSTEVGGNKNYKIRFTNCTVVRIPFPSGKGDSIYGYQFIKTTTPPTIVMMDGGGSYTITVDVNIDLQNKVFYYPIDTFQPIDIEDKGNGTYETLLIDNDSYIGYPAFWFTCYETATGPVFSVSGVNFEYGNKMNEMYNMYAFVMDRYDENTLYLQASPAPGYSFDGTANDYNVPIDTGRFYLVDTEQQPNVFTLLPIETSENTKVYINDMWTFGSSFGYPIYKVPIASFNLNYTTPSIALVPALRIVLDSSIPFEQTTTDTGIAGIDITSNSQAGEFVQNLNKWDGLPEHLTENEDSAQRVVMYAIHDTPNSSPEVPESRQTAALILDPGIPVNDPVEELSDEQKGRVYVISNDAAEYVNNGMTEFPKPPRTVARICDIPISVMQLANISGLAPTPIVDPKYVRSEASYKESEQERLINGLADKWVRPIHLNNVGVPIIDAYEDETSEFIFNRASHIKSVDLLNYNDFREHTQLNGMVDPTDVSLYLINKPGSGYIENDIGTIVVGGFAFDYVVSEVDSDGGVTDLIIYPSNTYPINIANFDMAIPESGITASYGTSPRGSSQGTGLKLQFKINNCETKIPSRGNVYEGLYALAKHYDGLWLHTYNTTTRAWEQSVLVAETEVTYPDTASTKDAYINSILPNVNALPVALKRAGVSETSLKVINSASFINVVDTDKTPIYDENPIHQKQVVDINKFYCHSIRKATANAKRFDAALTKIKSMKLDRFDSYIIWRWVDENNPASREFEFGIVHRSLNNLQSTDTTSYLPSNELKSKYYVNTNASTTITWNVEDFGPMVWVFNPESRIYEKYFINQHTRELYVERSTLTWLDVEVYSDNFQTKIDIADESGNLLWNIASNVLRYPDTRYSREPIYQQPDYVSNLAKGTYVKSISPMYQPSGCWELLFPRTQTFTFKNDVSGTQYNPTQMQVVRTTSIQPTTDILDIYGNPVNYRTIVVDDTDTESKIKIYNHETEQWENV